MINQEELFINEYEKQKISLNAWGEYVRNYIFQELGRQEYNIDYFLKTQVIVRLKDNTSILEKAFYRGKKYKNPLEDITDKVGIRFVVLLLDDIKIIQNIIEKYEEWDASEDRNFEEERLENPTIFGYQSVHYIIRNKATINVNNITISNLTPCEVQIRTLLQHAYSELTHDTVYKPKQHVVPIVNRLVARSMALIETTDSIFKEVNDRLIEEKNKFKYLLPALRQEYSKIKVPEENNKIQELIMDSYKAIIEGIDLNELMDFINVNMPILKEQITTKYNEQLLYRQPVILLLYYLIEKFPDKAGISWPLTNDLIKPIYTIMGINFKYN